MLAALAGGGLIGLASSTHLALAGRVTGFSGMIGSGLSNLVNKTVDYRHAFLGATLVSGGAVGTLAPELLGTPLQDLVPLSAVVASGSLVGIGTYFGTGCTSGHGVCGLPRLSGRSIVAVSAFFSTGLATATIASTSQTLHDLVRVPAPLPEPLVSMASFAPQASLACGSLLLATPFVRLMTSSPGPTTPSSESAPSLLTSALSGSVFAGGLVLSGMANPAKVAAFLDVSSILPALSPAVSTVWDPSLAAVMGGAVGLNLLLWKPIILKRTKPLLPSSTSFDLPTSKDITPRLVLGSSLFGVGWGIGGVCPGPALLGLASPAAGAVFGVWMASFISARLLSQSLDRHLFK